MLKIKDRKQQHLLDPWYFLSPKRRKMLDNQWPGFFREHILNKMPVDTLAKAFPSDQGRPTKELYTVLGALTLQQYHDLTDKQVVEQLAFNIQWHYALDKGPKVRIQVHQGDTVAILGFSKSYLRELFEYFSVGDQSI